MQMLPDFQIGLLNGWILLLAYLVGFLIPLASFTKEVRARIFADPKSQLRGFKRGLLTFGQLLMIGFIILMFFTPLKSDTIHFVAGMIIYFIGYLMVIVSLLYFNHAPDDQPITKGPYKYSRNPQWVGFFLALIGSALTSASWMLLAIILVVGVIYHIQILAEEQACLELYGEAYLKYKEEVPRYFYFF